MVEHPEVVTSLVKDQIERMSDDMGSKAWATQGV